MLDHVHTHRLDVLGIRQVDVGHPARNRIGIAHTFFERHEEIAGDLLLVRIEVDAELRLIVSIDFLPFHQLLRLVERADRLGVAEIELLHFQYLLIGIRSSYENAVIGIGFHILPLIRIVFGYHPAAVQHQIVFVVGQLTAARIQAIVNPLRSFALERNIETQHHRRALHEFARIFRWRHIRIGFLQVIMGIENSRVARQVAVHGDSDCRRPRILISPCQQVADIYHLFRSIVQHIRAGDIHKFLFGTSAFEELVEVGSRQLPPEESGAVFVRRVSNLRITGVGYHRQGYLRIADQLAGRVGLYCHLRILGRVVAVVGPASPHHDLIFGIGNHDALEDRHVRREIARFAHTVDRTLPCTGTRTVRCEHTDLRIFFVGHIGLRSQSHTIVLGETGTHLEFHTIAQALRMRSNLPLDLIRRRRYQSNIGALRSLGFNLRPRCRVGIGLWSRIIRIVRTSYAHCRKEQQSG